MRIRILGPLVVDDERDAIEIPGARVRRLLVRLAVDAPSAVSTDELIDAVRPDDPPATVVNALQSLVSRLRRALGDAGLVQQTTTGYKLAVDRSAVDVEEFERLAHDGKEALRAGNPAVAVTLLRDALALWRGAPASDADGAVYLAGYLARWDEERLQALAARLEAELSLGLPGDVVVELEQLVAEHPTRESFVGLLMRALVASGRTSDALSAYERLRAQLADELGSDPGRDLQDLHLAVLRGDTATRQPGRLGSTNIPASLTSFFGRGDESKRLSDLLDTSRLATLVGPGGAGKTRLASEVALMRRAQSPDGVWLIELAPVGDDAGVVGAFVSTLGRREAHVLELPTERVARDPLDTLIGQIHDTQMLLVVDNCEHVLDAVAATVERILASCADVRVLATSREPLGIDGESLCVLTPLLMPTEGSSVEAAMTTSATQLFVARAEAVDASFVLDDSTVGDVVSIVRRLDGLPLAIELAAARLRVLPVAEISLRLSDRFRLLTGGSRTAMPRHRTLRAVVDWSWSLLSDEERKLAERLAVFPSGATVASSSAICGRHGLMPDDIPELLDSLVDKSLLKVGDEQGLRYRMLETIREYGVERLADLGEVVAARAAHAEYFADLVSDLEPELRTARQLEALGTLEAERDNIAAALRFLCEFERADDALALVKSFSWLWIITGGHREATSWLEMALAVPGVTDLKTRAVVEAQYLMNRLASNDAETLGSLGQGDADDNASPWQRLQAEIAEIDDELDQFDFDDPMSIVMRPMLSFFAGNFERANRLVEIGLSSDDTWIRAATLTFRAALAENEGDVDTMRRDLQASLTELDAIDDRWLLGSNLAARARVLSLDGDLAASAEAFELARRYLVEVGSDEDMSYLSLRLTDVLLRMGDLDGARREIDNLPDDVGARWSPGEMFRLAILITIARIVGDLDEARARHADLKVEVERMPPSHPLQGHARAVSLGVLGAYETWSGNLDAARPYLDEAYTRGIQTRDMPILSQVGVAIADFALVSDDPDAAARILGAAARLRGSPDDSDLDIARLTTVLRAQLGADFDALYAEGRGLSRDQAIALLDPAHIQSA